MIRQIFGIIPAYDILPYDGLAMDRIFLPDSLNPGVTVAGCVWN